MSYDLESVAQVDGQRSPKPPDAGSSPARLASSATMADRCAVEESPSSSRRGTSTYNARAGEAPGLDLKRPGPGAEPEIRAGMVKGVADPERLRAFSRVVGRLLLRRKQVAEMTRSLEAHWAGVSFGGWSDFRGLVGANLAGMLVEEQMLFPVPPEARASC